LYNLYRWHLKSELEYKENPATIWFLPIPNSRTVSCNASMYKLLSIVLSSKEDD
jgi:hypothetical protein